MKLARFRYDPLRVVLATLGLAIAGAALGALAAAVAIATVMLLKGGVSSSFGLLALGLAGEVGAVLGLVSAPLVVWVMLRRVPLGRAFLWLTVSTVLGAIFGWVAFSSIDMIFGPTLAAFAAFIASAVVLSFRYERAPILTKVRFARFRAR